MLTHRENFVPITPSTIDETRQPICLFTIVRSEPMFLPFWIAHHKDEFPLHVLFHQDPTPQDIRCCQQHNVTHQIIYNSTSYCWAWITETANRYSDYLLKSYETVMYCDVDELIVDPNNVTKRKDLPNTIRAFGISPMHDVLKEPALDVNKTIGEQRNYVSHFLGQNKPIIKRNVNVQWDMGFHDTIGHPPIPILDDLHLIHMHFIDYDLMVKRHKFRGQFTNISQLEYKGKFGDHNFMHSPHNIRTILHRWIQHSVLADDKTNKILNAVDITKLVYPD